jgi:hypothetical protein
MPFAAHNSLMKHIKMSLISKVKGKRKRLTLWSPIHISGMEKVGLALLNPT